MTQAHTLGLSEALRVAGIKGGVVPGIADSIQPVMVLADFSATYTAEPFEARGLLSDRIQWAPNGVKRAYFELLATSPGGLVIESLFCLQIGGTGGTDEFFVDVLLVPPAAAKAPVLPPLNIGGRPTVSQGYIGTTDTLPTGVGPLDLSGSPIVPSPRFDRIYLTAGTRLVVTGNFAKTGGVPELYSTIVWREIPKPLGEP